MRQERITTSDSRKIPLEPDLPIHAAEDLTDGMRKAVITLKDQRYTLRITKQGKLLLTK